jgi:hypothetical protein
VRFEFAGYPGQQFHETVRVINASEEWLTVALEALDFAPLGEEGQIVVGEGAAGERSLASWVRPATSGFTIPPRSRYPVDFVVDIPVEAEPGTHYGTILAVAEARDGGGGAQIVTKVGAVLLADVYGDVREELRVAGFSVPQFSSRLPIELAARFENTGTVRARPHGQITVRNLFGRTVATLALEEANVLPGAVRRFPAVLGERLWAGRYTARLEATYGLTNPLSVASETSFWFIDWRNVGLPFLILLGTLLFLLSRRRNILPALRALRRGEDTRPNP